MHVLDRLFPRHTCELLRAVRSELSVAITEVVRNQTEVLLRRIQTLVPHDVCESFDVHPVLQRLDCKSMPQGVSSDLVSVLPVSISIHFRLNSCVLC